MHEIEGLDVQRGATTKKDNRTQKPMGKQQFENWRFDVAYKRACSLSARRAVEMVLKKRESNQAIQLLRQLLAIATTVDEAELTERELKAIKEAKEFCERN